MVEASNLDIQLIIAVLKHSSHDFFVASAADIHTQRKIISLRRRVICLLTCKLQSSDWGLIKQHRKVDSYLATASKTGLHTVSQIKLWHFYFTITFANMDRLL